MQILATEVLSENRKCDTKREGNKKVSYMGILATIDEFEASSWSAFEFPLEFLSDEESRISGSLKFAPLHIPGSNSARIPDSIKTVEAASVELTFTGRNPSAELFATSKDYEVELVIHPGDFIPANFDYRKWISNYDSFACENDSRVNKAVVGKKAKTQGPEQSAQAAYESAVEQFLNCEECEEYCCGNEIESVDSRSVNSLLQNASYTRNQSKQKRKLAS